MIKPLLLKLSFLLFLLLSSKELAAQMFSVNDPVPQSYDAHSSISVGVEPALLELAGTVSQTERDFSFKNTLYRVRYDASGVQLRVGFGNDLGIYNGSLFTVGAGFNSAFALNKSRFASFQGLFGLETDFLRIREGAGSRELAISTVNLSPGVQFVLNPTESIELKAAFQRGIGFMTRDYGVDGGRALQIAIPFSIHIKNLIRGKGLSMGVVWRKDDFDSRSTEIDYDAEFMQFSIGINF